jgi:DNA-binding CsgD family transcriptional regulator
MGAPGPEAAGGAEAWLTDIDGTGATRLGEAPVRIGREADNDLVINDDPKVSRHHAEVAHRDGAWWVTDRGSRNGTFVNDVKVAHLGLRDGDQLRVGSRRFAFIVGPDPRATVGEVGDGVPAAATLSAREREIVALVAAGSTDVQIARALHIGLSTVHTHLDRIRDKTGRRRRADLTRLASELGLQPPD